MNFSKTLAAALAATSIVGVVGLAYAQTTTEPAVISPAETQKAAAQDPSMKAPTEGTQGTQSGTTPAAGSTSPAATPVVTPTPATTPAPVTSDSTMTSEPAPKADRN